MSDKKYMNKIVAGFFICGAILTVALYIQLFGGTEKQIIAQAETNGPDFEWKKIAVDEGTTIDADYLWPEEDSPEFTGIYRDGKRLEEEKMVTVTSGTVYHFRGKSGNKTLYAQVYPGTVKSTELKGESATWYRLLPSTIRNGFEQEGWTWETGPSYDDRAELNEDDKKIIIVEDDSTAVLYGIGLYLDNIHDYKSDLAFIEEYDIFESKFGEAGNIFAQALENYYVKGGELRATCPGIYAMVADALSQLDTETARIRENMESSQLQEQTEKPVLKKELLEYVNNMRSQNGLSTVIWNADNDDNVIGRASEVSVLFSETRPDGTDAFTAYTDAVMSEIRIEHSSTTEELYECAASYFQMPELTSFTCASYGNISVIVFVW